MLAANNGLLAGVMVEVCRDWMARPAEDGLSLLPLAALNEPGRPLELVDTGFTVVVLEW